MMGILDGTARCYGTKRVELSIQLAMGLIMTKSMEITIFFALDVYRCLCKGRVTGWTARHKPAEVKVTILSTYNNYT